MKYKELLSMDLNVKVIGEPQNPSPIDFEGDNDENFVSDSERVLVVNTSTGLDGWMKSGQPIPSFERAGPRKKIFHKPGEVTSAIVTCGGLCPGLNSVIRSVVYMNYYIYNNRVIYGIPYGYEGFIDSCGHPIVNLTPDIVENIHTTGGTILGSSRGPQNPGQIVDKLVTLDVDILYCVGGDGTLRGASDIAQEIAKRNLKISVIGIPKTIDNDIAYIDRSFGSETAFSKACDAIASAHMEAKGAYNGIGIVKVMGRHSGFIAANATIASGDVNICLVPEVPFELDGDGGFLASLAARLVKKHHVVILVAEGAGQQFFEGKEKFRDASGNEKLEDIGVYLKERIVAYLKQKKIPFSVKYIDPSYIIRSTEPTPNDSIFCMKLAQKAVHAGMSGKTDIVIGYFNGEFIHLPIKVATSSRQVLTPTSDLWLSVLESTRQPSQFRK
jgi:6-phosphofructokinase 1